MNAHQILIDSMSRPPCEAAVRRFNEKGSFPAEISSCEPTPPPRQRKGFVRPLRLTSVGSKSRIVPII